MSFIIEKFRSNPNLYAALFFAVMSCLFFLPIVFQGKLLAPGDALVQYLPAFQGGTHIWTTQILCGFPWYADPQSQTFYPLKHLLSPIPGGWNIYMIAVFTLAGYFAALYAHSLTGCWTAALIAGCIYGYNGFLLSNLRHTTIVHSAMWLPLALWSIRRARIDLAQEKNTAARWFSLTVSASALLCLAGHPQMFCYGLALLAAYVIAETCEAEKKHKLRFAVLSYFALALGVGIAAVSILPASELARFTWRWNMTYKLFVEYGLLPVNLIDQVFPFVFGCFKESIYGCKYFGAYDIQTLSGYCGLFTFLLFPMGVIVFRRDKVIIFWTIALTVFFILLFGDVGPLSQAAYQLPCYSRFRVPTRHFMEISMALSCLSAAGVAALAGGKISKKVGLRSHAAFVAFFGVAACLAFLCAAASQDRVRDLAAGTFGVYPWTNPALGIPIVLFVLGSAVFIICLNRPQMRWHAMILIFVIDFATFALGSEYAVLSPPASSLSPPPHAAWLNGEAATSHHRVLSLRGNSGSRDELPVNLSMLWGVENACGYENLLPQRISNLLSMKEGGFLLGTWAKDEDHTLDILAVKYILLPKNDSRYPAPTGPRWRFVKEAGDALIYENLRVMPRVWLAQNAGNLPQLSPDEIAQAVKTGKLAGSDIDFKSTVLLEEKPGDSPAPQERKRDAHAGVEIVSASENEMTVSVTAEQPCLLVTADSYYPGWEAYINNDKTPTGVLQANYAIRAVPVPQGKSTVRFVFAPPLLKTGMAISVLCLVSSALMAIMIHLRFGKKTFT